MKPILIQGMGMPNSSSVALPSLSNPYFHLEVLDAAGPRISALVPAGSNQNLLAELEDEQWDSPYGRYHLYGGHRLWAAPEDPAVSYFPEDDGCRVELLPDGVRLTREDEGGVHYERSIEIRLEADAPRVHLLHTLRNLGSSPLTAAPWAITVLPMGSRVRVPLATRPGVGGPLLPNRSLVFWPYSNLADQRFSFGLDSIHFTTDPALGPFKMGVYSTSAWAAAQTGNWLLVKHFTLRPLDTRLDFGANLEVYTTHTFLELETLGELRTMGEGESVEHEETWEVIPGRLEDLDANGKLSTFDWGKP
jgi:hypothetical protein